MALDELYQEILLDHYKNPRNKGHLDHPDIHLDAKNPFCGDEVSLNIKIKDDIIEDILFEGDGCVISQASVSLLTDSVKGKTIHRAGEIVEMFGKLIRGEEDTLLDEELEELMAMQGVSEFPTRIKCALLAWNTLKKALLEYEAKEHE